jgi:hypothetical protein
VQPKRDARALIAALSSIAFVSLTSCQANDTYPVDAVEGPELDIALSTDLAIPAEIDSIRIERWVTGISSAPLSTEEHELGPTGLELPTLLYWSGFSQPAFDRTVDVRVVAWKGTQPVVFAEALFMMPDAGVLVVPLVLETQCSGQVKVLADSSFTSSCPDLQTCRNAHCASIDRGSESL